MFNKSKLSDFDLEKLQKSHLKAYLELTLAAVIWGISFIATKVAVGEAPPAVVIWLRFTIALVILFLYLILRKQLSIPPRTDLVHFALLGFIGISFHQWLQSTGLVTAQASTTSWLVSTSPIFMAILGWLVLKEKLTFPAILGIGVASFGVILIVSNGSLVNFLNGKFGSWGNFLVIISAINWAIFSVLSRKVLNRYAAIFVLFYALLFGVLFSSIHFISIRGWIYVSKLSSAAWLAVAFLGIGCSFLAYLFWYDGLQTVSTSQAGIFLYIEPLVSLIAAALILNEVITLAALLGGGLILLGIWLVSRI